MGKAVDFDSFTIGINKQKRFFMLYVYPKNKQEDLTPQQCKLLSRLVREEFK
jgi:hypothetical protein